MNKIYLLAVLLAFSSLGRAAESTSVPASDDLLAALHGYEWQFNPARLAQLPGDAWQGFMDIANDGAQPGFIRARAATALMAFPNAEVWQFYVSRLASDQPVQHRRRSVEALCEAFGAARAAPHLTDLLASRDAHLRVRAASCLQDADTAVARDALAGYQARLSDGWERKAAGFASE